MVIPLYVLASQMKDTTVFVPNAGLVTARYWKLDNFQYHSSGAQVYGLAFLDGTMSKINPLTLMTNVESAMYLNYVMGEGGSARNMDAVTEVVFDYSMPVTPASLSIYGNEWDEDYIESADISFSADGSTWFLLGTWNRTEVAPIWTADRSGRYNPLPSFSATYVPRMNSAVVLGRVPGKTMVSRLQKKLILGRPPTGNIYTPSFRAAVITIPE